MPVRIWFDVTGVRPGSEAALLAVRLGSALAGRPDVTLELCRRDPGLQRLARPALDALLTASAARRRTVPGAAALRRLAQRLPGGSRAALRRFMGLQLASLRVWRRAAPASGMVRAAAAPIDAVRSAQGDVLLMLAPAGDAARFAQDGVQLALVAADARAWIRPDWMDRADAAAVSVWQRTTLAHVGVTITFSADGAAGLLRAACPASPAVVSAAPCLGPAAARPARAERPFVLALGEIGEAGQTRHLLLAWRRLLDRRPAEAVPMLVLAGAPGPLSGDVLAQLDHSRMLGGHVRLVQHPTLDERAQLLDLCLFTIAPDTTGWGHGALDSLAAGRACLCAAPVPGTLHIDPTNATDLAARVEAWTDAPPPIPYHGPARSWDDVAADILAALRR